MRRPAVLLLLAACVLGSCGGGGGDRESAEDVLDQGFSHPMRSADLKLEAELNLKGLTTDPIRIEAEGPFVVNPHGLPSTDIELRLGSGGGGQTITSGVLTTGDRAFVKFQDVYYEQPPARVRQAIRTLRRDRARSGTPLRALGLDPRSWLYDARDEGEADVGGVETRHIAGTLDIESLLRNLNRFVRRSGSALDDRSAPRVLREADIRELRDAVKDPSFDVYVGKEDGIIRRVSGRLEFDIPAENRAELHGLEGGSITFSVQFDHVNGNQHVEAPAKARPLSELTNSLGVGALGGLTQGGSGTETQPLPDDQGAPGSGNGSADAFRRYEDCLDKARPEDTDELQRCARLLKQP